MSLLSKSFCKLLALASVMLLQGCCLLTLPLWLICVDEESENDVSQDQERNQIVCQRPKSSESV